jgi:hypothetical protein
MAKLIEAGVVLQTRIKTEDVTDRNIPNFGLGSVVTSKCTFSIVVATTCYLLGSIPAALFDSIAQVLAIERSYSLAPREICTGMRPSYKGKYNVKIGLKKLLLLLLSRIRHTGLRILFLFSAFLLCPLPCVDGSLP